MTRKEYIKIAAVLKQAKFEKTRNPAYAIDMIQTALIDMFTADNPRFDSQRFRAACRDELTALSYDACIKAECNNRVKRDNPHTNLCKRCYDASLEY